MDVYLAPRSNVPLAWTSHSSQRSSGSTVTTMHTFAAARLGPSITELLTWRRKRTSLNT